ncbi:DUF1345 domain-containing protein [Nigerium massiliense]|uniref:DUF1345 domain-containing protein n=1 Tax=Nigerium massiliense TaxID=1522317 RepID=UPI0012FD7C4C|nr:DUF1345 domain-containing protein [Nigerium massiliense]
MPTIIAVAVGLGVGSAAYANRWFEPPETAWFITVCTWLTLTVSHLVLTWVAFRRREGDDLRAMVQAPKASQKPSLLRRLFVSSDAPAWSLTSAVLALVGMVGVTVTRHGTDNGSLMTLTFALVAACWLDVVVVYAEHYARLDLADPAQPEGHLGFPGSDVRHHFDDYLYLALGVQATFGTTDVEARTTEMRRHVGVHALIAFVFNTVIVAVAVALITAMMG